MKLRYFYCYRFKKYNFKFFVQKVLRGCENLGFRVVEQFVEHGKLVLADCVPNIRDFGACSKIQVYLEQSFCYKNCSKYKSI